MLVVKILGKTTWCVVQCAFVMFYFLCLQSLPFQLVVEFGLCVELGFFFAELSLVVFSAPNAGFLLCLMQAVACLCPFEGLVFF